MNADWDWGKRDTCDGALHLNGGGVRRKTR